MILLNRPNRLDAFAKQRGFFFEMRFGFQEGVGYIEASFVILETVNISVALLTFVKPSTWCGLMVCCTIYSQSWELEAECG